MKKYLWLLTLLTGAAFADQKPIPPALDVPKELPLTATVAAVCIQGSPKVMVVVVTYADGRVLRFDIEHMYGFETAQQLLDYAQTAKDVRAYLSCEGAAST